MLAPRAFARLAKPFVPAAFASTSEKIDALLAVAHHRDPHQVEFLQALEEVVRSLKPVFDEDSKYTSVFERLMEPERAFQFRVPWVDDKGVEQVNRGFRVQYNSAIGPYKGGLRLDPSVNLSIIKFLGFEQIFKNALTTLPMGGGKGGSDFNPQGRSDAEVMRFCQSFMTELQRHIGPDTDVPAGDIGVGGREIGFLFGQFKRIRNEFVGTLTGKGLNFGGSLIRPEATGYGAVYFLKNMLTAVGRSMVGKQVAVSGAGNVAQYCVEKLLDEGAVPITMGDRSGYIHEPAGVTREQLAGVMHHVNVLRRPLSEFKGLSAKGKFIGEGKPWDQKCDIAMPCATQNEILEKHAVTLRDNGCFAVCEGANMPTTNDAVEIIQNAGILYGLGKAANAGGVGVSGLEMSQNSIRLQWTREEVDERLRTIMATIHQNAWDTAKTYGQEGNLQLGANCFAFKKVADAMLAQGCV